MVNKRRPLFRGKQTVDGISEIARLVHRSIRKAGVPSSDMDDFIDWTINSLWTTFKEERMNRRYIIEEKMRSLHLSLPNGTVNKAYHVEFNLPVDEISKVSLVGATEIGLSFTIDDDGKCILTGIPLSIGDFILRLRYNTVKGEPESELSLPIAFNPDPRSLWKDIPTDMDIRYFKPDNVCQLIKVRTQDTEATKKDIIAASHRGRSHAQEGKPRDDHFGIFHCDESDWYIMAVADGAGSAKYSREGSRIACDTAIDHCKSLLIENSDFENAVIEYEAERENKQKRTELTRRVIEIIYNGAVKAHGAIKKFADSEEDANFKDYATTLMFAICKKFDFGWFIASFWVGDGAFCLLDTTGKTAKLLGTPDEGEFSGQTRFLTMQDIFRDPEVVAKRLRMAIVPDFTALFLMTDGVSDPMFETEKNLNSYDKWVEFYDKLQYGFPEDNIAGVNLESNDAEKQLLRWLDFWSPGNHDDRTIVILH